MRSTSLKSGLRLLNLKDQGLGFASTLKDDCIQPYSLSSKIVGFRLAYFHTPFAPLSIIQIIFGLAKYDQPKVYKAGLIPRRLPLDPNDRCHFDNPWLAARRFFQTFAAGYSMYLTDIAYGFFKFPFQGDNTGEFGYINRARNFGM